MTILAPRIGAENAKLIATHFLEQFYTNLQLSMFGAGVIAFPIIAQQIYKFVAPGLYRNERNAFLPYLIATPVFFLLDSIPSGGPTLGRPVTLWVTSN